MDTVGDGIDEYPGNIPLETSPCFWPRRLHNGSGSKQGTSYSNYHFLSILIISIGKYSSKHFYQIVEKDHGRRIKNMGSEDARFPDSFSPTRPPHLLSVLQELKNQELA
jgi:hypothetical protein